MIHPLMKFVPRLMKFSVLLRKLLEHEKASIVFFHPALYNRQMNNLRKSYFNKWVINFFYVLVK